MFIKQSYDEEFQHLMLDLRDKYPKQIFEKNGISEKSLDIVKYAENYFLKKNNVSDTTIDPNANVQIRSVHNFNIEKFKGLDKLTSIWLLWRRAKKNWGTRRANDLIERELIKDINVQDFSNISLSYCFAFDTFDLVEKGLPFITNRPSKPANHADTFLRHAEQLVMFASNQMMGATAIPNVVIVYSMLLQKDLKDKDFYLHTLADNKKLLRCYLRQEFKKFIFTINQPIRSGQSPFTNVTFFDKLFMKEATKYYSLNGVPIDVDFALEIQEVFMECFLEFNEKYGIFTFPVGTAQFKTNENAEPEDEKFFKFACAMNLKYGHLNIMGTSDLTALSSCCRLQSNVEDILKAMESENVNLIGGSTIKVGSVGVTSLNLPRLALRANKDIDVLFALIRESSKDCFDINHCRRQLVEDKISEGEMPLYTYGFMNLKNQYSTLGYIGLNEMVEIMGYDILEPEGRELACKVLKELDTIVKRKAEKFGYKCNMEQIPGEATAVKLAEVDKTVFKKSEWYPLYSNQYIPLTKEADMISRIELDSEFEKYNSGGSILHINVGEAIQTVEQMEKLVRYVLKKGVKYFAINYFFAECSEGHTWVNSKNNVTKCPVCGNEPVEWYTRIVGFITKISAWMTARREESDIRKTYSNGQLEIREEE